MKKLIVTSLIIASLLLSTIVYAEQETLTENAPEEVYVGDNHYIDGILYEDENYLEKENMFNSLLKNNMHMYSSRGATYDEWINYKTTYVYTKQETDTFNCYNDAPASYTLSVKTEAEAKITGSTKFGFKEIAEASLSIELGEKWGKEYTVVIHPKKETSYHLKAACKNKKRYYEYVDEYWTITGNKYRTYKAYSYDKVGTEKWFWTTSN